mmetsp:Transcript_26708/g.56796  ORF Transcript_26708/g.56796 Transcript_26708/m.56796 type:complete len:220 (-) Transcript_26708:194-853(-)
MKKCIAFYISSRNVEWNIYFLLLNLLLLGFLPFSTFSAPCIDLVSALPLSSLIFLPSFLSFALPASGFLSLTSFLAVSPFNEDSACSNFSIVASSFVLLLASLCHAAGFRLYNSEMSGTSPSSGFGSAISDRMLSRRLGSDTAGLHDPAGGDLSVSRHILPPESTFGWYSGVRKRQRGGSKGYRPVMLTVTRNIPDSNGDPSGPVIWARSFVMSEGWGA